MPTLVLEWNGHDLPPALQALPPGRYVIEPAMSPDALGVPPEDVAAIEEALANRHVSENIPAAAAAEHLRQLIASKARR